MTTTAQPCRCRKTAASTTQRAKMHTIYIRSNETAKGDYMGDIVEEFTGETMQDCGAHFDAHYDINDYSYSYSR